MCYTPHYDTPSRTTKQHITKKHSNNSLHKDAKRPTKTASKERTSAKIFEKRDQTDEGDTEM
eukprot:12411182-Karenia_brevis.AAC.1